MKKVDINNIKKMLDAYNELIERIKFLNAENKKIMSTVATLENLEPCNNVNTAIDALKAEYKLNNDFIIEYTMQANEYDELIENAYDETRNYKDELKQDAINSFKAMIANATVDLSVGYTYDYFEAETNKANNWLKERMTKLDVIANNFEAFAFMINTGIGSL